MEKKTFLIFLFFTVIFFSGCVDENTDKIKTTGTTPLLLTPIPILDTNQIIDSDAKAQELFNQSLDAIIDATKKTLINNFSGYHLGVRDSCLENNEILRDYILFEGSDLTNDYNITGYKFKIYLIKKGTEWKKESEKIYYYRKTCDLWSINETTGEKKCENFIQYWEHAKNINYIIESSGTIIMLGGYCQY